MSVVGIKPEVEDDVGQQAAGQADAGDAQGDGDGGMGVDDRLHVGALAVGLQVQQDLGAGLEAALRAIAAGAGQIALPVHDDELVGAHEGLADAAGGHQEALARPAGR